MQQIQACRKSVIRYFFRYSGEQFIRESGHIHTGQISKVESQLGVITDFMKNSGRREGEGVREGTKIDTVDGVQKEPKIPLRERDDFLERQKVCRSLEDDEGGFRKEGGTGIRPRGGEGIGENEGRLLSGFIECLVSRLPK